MSLQIRQALCPKLRAQRAKNATLGVNSRKCIYISANGQFLGGVAALVAALFVNGMSSASAWNIWGIKKESSRSPSSETESETRGGAGGGTAFGQEPQVSVVEGIIIAQAKSREPDKE